MKPKCSKCQKPFVRQGRERLCGNCRKVKLSVECAGLCGRQFRPKKPRERVCARCKLIGTRTAVQYKLLASPNFTLPIYRRFVDMKLRDPGVKCRYCAGRLTARNFSLDHRVPKERGGSDCISNVDLICGDCNTIKGVLLPEEFEGLWKWMDSLPAGERGKIGPKGRFLGALKTGAKLRLRMSRRFKR